VTSFGWFSVGKLINHPRKGWVRTESSEAKDVRCLSW